MIKETYVSFELAKLLKEKGFNEPSFAYYSEFDDWKILRFWRKYARSPINTFYLCTPTHQMACAWLREKGFEIGVFYLFKAINNVTVFGGYIPNVTQVIDGVYKDSWDMDVVKNYNNAVEAAIKYTVENLI